MYIHGHGHQMRNEWVKKDSLMYFTNTMEIIEFVLGTQNTVTGLFV